MTRFMSTTSCRGYVSTGTNVPTTCEQPTSKEASTTFCFQPFLSSFLLSLLYRIMKWIAVVAATLACTSQVEAGWRDIDVAGKHFLIKHQGTIRRGVDDVLRVKPFLDEDADDDLGAWGAVGTYIGKDIFFRPAGDGSCGPGNRCRRLRGRIPVKQQVYYSSPDQTQPKWTWMDAEGHAGDLAPCMGCRFPPPRPLSAQEQREKRERKMENIRKWGWMGDADNDLGWAGVATYIGKDIFFRPVGDGSCGPGNRC